MKKYIVWERGGMYADFEYIRLDLENGYKIKEVFSLFEDAYRVAKKLNRQFFMSLEHDFMKYWEAAYDFNNRPADWKFTDPLLHYLIFNLGANPTLMMTGHYSYEEILDFIPRELTDEEIDTIIELSEVTICEVVEVDDDEQYCYRLRLNPKYDVLEPAVEDEPYNDGRYFEPLLFNTKKDFLYWFCVDQPLTYFLMDINEHRLLKGEYEELSNFPHLLKELIQTNQNLFTFENEVIRISECYPDEELIKLNGLLKEPLFFIEEVDVYGNHIHPKNRNDEQKTDKVISLLHSENETISQFAYDADFLKNIGFILTKDWDIVNILEKRLSQVLPEISISEDEKAVLYKGEIIVFHSVIHSMEVIDGDISLISCFIRDNNKYWNTNITGYGKGKNIPEAFKRSLVDWLDKYITDLVKEIKTKDEYL